MRPSPQYQPKLLEHMVQLEKNGGAFVNFLEPDDAANDVERLLVARSTSMLSDVLAKVQDPRARKRVSVDRDWLVAPEVVMERLVRALVVPVNAMLWMGWGPPGCDQAFNLLPGHQPGPPPVLAAQEQCDESTTCGATSDGGGDHSTLSPSPEHRGRARLLSSGPVDDGLARSLSADVLELPESAINEQLELSAESWPLFERPVDTTQSDVLTSED